MICQRKTHDRIADIEQEIRGVKSLYNITDFECRVMATLKTQQSGSDAQLKILASIERKVFGRVKDQQLIEINENGEREVVNV